MSNQHRHHRKMPHARPRMRMMGAAACTLALIASGCGSDGKASSPPATAAPTTTGGAPNTTTGGAPNTTTGAPGTTITPDTTPVTSPGGGAAGIPSDPRDVAGMWTIDNGIAMFKTRPADENRTGVTDKEILLGVHLPLTGPLAGISNVDALRAMADAVNEAGGIHGRKLKLVIEDNTSTPTQAAAVVQKLVEQDKVFAMFGAQGSGAVTGTVEYLEANKIPSIATNAHASRLYANTEYSWDYYAPTELLASSSATVLFHEHPNGKVVVIYQNDATGKSALAPLRAVAARDGGSIVAEIGYEAASPDLSSQVRQAVDAKPDAIFIEGFLPQVQGMMKTLRETLGSDIPVYTGGAGPLNLLTGSAPDFDGTVGVTPVLSNLADDPRAKLVNTFFTGLGIKDNSSNFLATEQFELLTRGLALAGPDLTREGLVEAMNTGFTDGSWTCWICFAPNYLSATDHFSVETAQPVRWDDSKQALVPFGDPVTFESSKGEGIADICPDCLK